MRPEWCPSSSSTYRDWVVFEDRRKNGNNYQDTDSSISLVNTATGEFKKITTSYSDWQPNWSPDCSQIVFTRYDDNDTVGLFADLMLLDLTTGSENTLVNSANFSAPAELSANWSSDGQWIAFRKIADTNGDGIYRGADDRNELWVIRPDGSREHALITNYSVASISWSPDSQFIVFTTQNDRLLVCDLEGEIIFDFGGNYFHPSWAT